jgi:hypothetical protein
MLQKVSYALNVPSETAWDTFMYGTRTNFVTYDGKAVGIRVISGYSPQPRYKL